MKLVTFVEPYFKQERLGFWIDDAIIDSNLAYASYLKEQNVAGCYSLASATVPPNMLDFLRVGEPGMRAAHETHAWLEECYKKGKKTYGPNGELVVFPIKQVRLRAPVPRPGKIVHTAGNFREHADEGKKSGWDFPIPPWISFLKNPSAVIGHEDPIVYPKITRELDHEIELAIIIGKRGKHIPQDKANEYIAGFTIFNDITARDIQREEMKSGLLNLGKNLDTFAPLGPCLVTRNQIGDVHKLKIELRVNGDVRQSSSTSRLHVPIQRILEHYSQAMTFEPGDVLTTGTVSGVAAFRTPDPTPYYLKPGDVVESEIENIGVLRNAVVAEE